MEKRNVTKQKFLQMSLGNNKNPTNIVLSGHDKGLQINFHSKGSKNIYISPSAKMGRRIRQCCLYKYPKNEIMLTLPENGKFLLPDGLPLIIESQYLENFKAAIYPPQEPDTDIETKKENVIYSLNDCPIKITGIKQHPFLKDSEKLLKEEQKKKIIMMKHICSLKANLEKIGKTLEEIEQFQTESLKESQKILFHNRINEKYKIKNYKRHGESLTTSKSAEVVDDGNQSYKVPHHVMKKQTEQEKKLERKESLINNCSTEPGDFTSVGNTMSELADNMKSSKLMLDDILQREKIMSEYKKKYIQDVEALYEDQQRLLEGICNIYDCSDIVSSEEILLNCDSANLQLNEKDKTCEASEFRSDLPGTESTYKLNSMPVETNALTKQNVEKQLALKNFQIEKLRKEIQLLRKDYSIEKDIDSSILKKNRQSQQTATETSQFNTATNGSINASTKPIFKEVKGIITHKYNILKGEKCKGNIYETTLTQTIKNFPSTTSDSLNESSDTEYLEALADSKTAMKKLEATLGKLIPVFPKIGQKSGVGYDTPITISHHEENISGKILLSDQSIGKSDEEISEDKESQRSKKTTKDNLETIISTSTGTVPKHSVFDNGRKLSNKGSMGFDVNEQFLEQSFFESKRDSVNVGNSGKKPYETGTLTIPSSTDRKDSERIHDERHQDIDDERIQPLRIHYPSFKDRLESTRISLEEFGRETHVSSPHLDSIQFRQDNKENLAHFPEKPFFSESHMTQRRGNDLMFSLKDRPSIQHELEKESTTSLSESLLDQPKESKQFISKKHDTFEDDSIEEGTISSISQYEIEPSMTSDRRYSNGKNKSTSDVIEEGTISRISQYEIEPPVMTSDQCYSNGRNKSISDVIEERTLSNILQCEAEPSMTSNQSYSNENYKPTTGVIEGTASSISQHELEPFQDDDRKKTNESKKFRNDMIEKETISSISQNKIDKPKQYQHTLNEPNKQISDIIEEGSISSISQYELEPQKLDRYISREHFLQRYVPDTYVKTSLHSDNIGQQNISNVPDYEQRVNRNSNEHSRSWYILDKYKKSSLDEPNNEESNQIEKVNLSNISNYKPENSDLSHTFSKEQSRRWYVPDIYTGSSLDEPSNEDTDQIKQRTLSNISNYKPESSDLSHTFSKEQSRRWYVPDIYTGSSLDEPSNEDNDQIKQRTLSNIFNYKPESSDLSRTFSKEQSRRWYVPDIYTGSSLDEPSTENSNQIEEGNISNISNNYKPENSYQISTSNEQSRSWYVPDEYMGSFLSEPSSKEFSQSEKGMLGIPDYEIEQLRTSDLSNHSRTRSLPLYKYQDKHSSIFDRLHHLNTHLKSPLSDSNVMKMPNAQLNDLPTTFSESSKRTTFPQNVSVELSLNKRNSRHNLPYAFDFENNKASYIKSTDRTSPFHKMLGNTKNRDVSGRTQFRGVSYLNELKNKNNMNSPHPDFTDKYYGRFIKRYSPGQQECREFGSLEETRRTCKSPSSTKAKNVARRQTFDINYDYNQRDKIRKLYDDIMS